MFQAFTLLLAGALIPTMLIYGIGMLFLKKLRLTTLTQLAGLLIALVFTAITALVIAERPNVESAMNQIVVAAIAGSAASILLLSFAGRRKPREEESSSSA